MVKGLRGLPGEIAGKSYVRLLLSPNLFFLISRYSLKRWWGQVFWHLWIGRARHPGPPCDWLTVEVFNVGGWLTHEHRLVPARARGEWARLRVLPLFGRQPPRSLHMLVMLV